MKQSTTQGNGGGGTTSDSVSYPHFCSPSISFTICIGLCVMDIHIIAQYFIPFV